MTYGENRLQQEFRSFTKSSMASSLTVLPSSAHFFLPIQCRLCKVSLIGLNVEKPVSGQILFCMNMHMYLLMSSNLLLCFKFTFCHSPGHQRTQPQGKPLDYKGQGRFVSEVQQTAGFLRMLDWKPCHSFLQKTQSTFYKHGYPFHGNHMVNYYPTC